MIAINEISFHDLAIKSFNLFFEENCLSIIIYKFIDNTDEVTELELIFHDVRDFSLDRLDTVKITEIYSCEIENLGERSTIVFIMLLNHPSISVTMSFNYCKVEIIGEWHSAWNR